MHKVHNIYKYTIWTLAYYLHYLMYFLQDVWNVLLEDSWSLSDTCHLHSGQITEYIAIIFVLHNFYDHQLKYGIWTAY